MKSPMLKTILSIGMLLLFTQGCGVTTGLEKTEEKPLPRMNRIAVLPMDRVSVKPGQEKATCALSDTVFEASEISPESADHTTRILFRILEGKKQFKPVPESECIGFLNSLINADVKASQIRLIQAFGKELGVDAVLYGKLFRYEERIGGPYAVKRPASVAFTLHLIRISDGAVLWRSAFDEEQQPLSENLFKFRLFRKSGMRWLTAGELAEYGLDMSLEELIRRLP